MPESFPRTIALSKTTKFVVDNRGKTAPTATDGVVLIATNCVSNGDLYPSHKNVRYVSHDTYSNWFRAHPKPGDIILTLKGSQNGAVCLVPDPVDFAIAQDMVALRADEDVIEPLFLFAALRSNDAQNQIKNLDVSGVIPHLKKSDFDKLLLPYPDRASQKFIGDFYFSLSAKIELNKRMNETLEAIARAIFKDWFVDFGPTRAKMERHSPYLAGEIWSLFPDSLDDDGNPEGWHAGALSDVSSLNPESWSRATYPETIDYVDLSNTKWGMIEAVTRYASEAAPSRAQRILRPGDTIVGTVRPGNGSYTYISTQGLTGSTGFAVLRPVKPIFREAVYLGGTSKENIERLAHLADGGAYPAVRPELVAATELVAAPENIFAAFSASTSALINRAEANKQEINTLAALRDLLLPKLMLGEVRVKDAEKIVGDTT
jgi:type I restriction enzyme S subunit